MRKNLTTQYWFALCNDDTWQGIDSDCFYDADSFEHAKEIATKRSKEALRLFFPESEYLFLKWDNLNPARRYITDADTQKIVFRLRVGIEDGEYINEPLRHPQTVLDTM